jgi:stage II sporulation protein D
MEEAIRKTDSLILAYQQHAFRPFFSKSCGGKTATYEEAWDKPPEDYPFYAVPCSYCLNLKNADWHSIVPLKTIQKISGFRLNSIQREKNWLLFTNRTSTVKITSEDFRIRLGRVLGWRSLPGNQFDLEQIGDQVEFRGRRIGHGLGLCQTGTCEMAKQGATYQEILQHYFPNTEIRIATD